MLSACFQKRVRSATNSSASETDATGTINMLKPSVARQSYGAAGSGDRQQTAFVAPQVLKGFYVETRPLRLWRHKTKRTLM